MYDKDHDTALRQWLTSVYAWERGDDPQREAAEKEGIRYYWDWEMPSPNPECYRPVYSTAATCYQVYETVSEGTPISPVFETENELIEWLVKEGDTEEFAREFIRQGGSAEPFHIGQDGDMKTLKILYDKGEG